jgi:hypothetical protein
VLFGVNARFVSAFIVQTQVMKEGLEATFPSLIGRVHIIPQPPPRWVLEADFNQSRPIPKHGLSLLYPAAYYDHKNHSILDHIEINNALRQALKQITLTISPDNHSDLESKLVRYVGILNEYEMIQQYRMADALLFLSKKESYGFPLLEAMWLKLPIICPDLPYARWMCGDGAIYFDPDSPLSLQTSIIEMHTLLKDGWRPDWSEQLKKIPANWAECGHEFLELCKFVGSTAQK